MVLELPGSSFGGDVLSTAYTLKAWVSFQLVCLFAHVDKVRTKQQDNREQEIPVDHDAGIAGREIIMLDHVKDIRESCPHIKVVLAMMNGSQKDRIQKPNKPTKPMPMAAKASSIWKPLFRGQPIPEATSSA